ncbi:hypothetical protein GmHk_13G036815 [Glycine max]|nr:hypothetical protein GmHk_13G036815 [Glycine max]
MVPLDEFPMLEYWRPKILFSIAIGIGIPLLLDDARVLVDVDLMHDLRDQILFERAGYAFFVDVVYERLPSFCSSCKIVGHSFESCKKRAKEVSRKLVDPKGEPRKKQIYVPKNKNKDHKVIQDDVVIRPGPSYTNNPEGHVSPPDLVDVVPQTQPEISDC